MMTRKDRYTLVCRSCKGRHIGTMSRLYCVRCWQPRACRECRVAPRVQNRSFCAPCAVLRHRLFPAKRKGPPMATPGREANIERYAERAARQLPLFDATQEEI